MKKRICITIEPKLLAEAKKQAEKEYRTLTSLIEIALIEHLKKSGGSK